MTDDLVLTALVTAITVAFIALLIHRHLAKEASEKLKSQLSITNEAERQVHRREMEYLADKNKAEVAHADALAQARSTAFEEGRKQGKAEHELDCSMRLADQRNEFAIRLQSEKEQAATEARDRQRAEQELQAKLFSVRISPYVQLLTDNGLFKDTYEAKIGYQYQLLVNGIPAFQPHVFVERHEKVEQVDQSVKTTLLSIAQNCAEAAVTTYLGASPQFAKLAPGVLEQIAKK